MVGSFVLLEARGVGSLEEREEEVMREERSFEQNFEYCTLFGNFRWDLLPVKVDKVVVHHLCVLSISRGIYPRTCYALLP